MEISDWAQITMAASAVVIAIAALVGQIQHNRKAFQPLLTVDVFASKAEAIVRISNVGLGPAKIWGGTLGSQGQLTKLDDEEALSAYQSVVIDTGEAGRFIYNTVEYPIAAGGSVDILIFRPAIGSDQMSDELYAAVRQFVMSIEATVDYYSLYGQNYCCTRPMS